jgi:FkbM family methyltransferase
MITIPGVSLVFGPIGGGQVAPPLFKEYFGDGWRRERLRSAVVTHGLRYNPLTRVTLKRAALVLATNSATRSRAMELGASRVELMLDTAVPMNMRPSPVDPQQPVTSAFTYLWVGRILALKGLRLALEAFEMAAANADIKLRIVGDGPELAESQAWVSEHNLGDRVTFTGRLDWNEVGEEYDRADAFLFSSLRDSSGAQVLEAVAFGLPVVTLDHHGVGEFLPDEASVKVPVTTPTATKHHLAAALVGLANDREGAKRKGDAATAFSREATWPAKVVIAETYLVALHALSTPTSETGTNSLLRKIRNTIVCRVPGVQNSIVALSRRGRLPERFWRRIAPIGTFTLNAPSGEPVTYVADEGDFLARSIVWSNLHDWEETSTPVFCELARTSAGFLDIGAYTGIYTLLACAVNPNLKARAFEPNPKVHDRLVANLRANSLQGRAMPLMLALLDDHGTGTLHVPGDETAAMLGDPSAGGIPVRIGKADDYADDLDVDLVKIDVEGLEPQILRGMSNIITRRRPSILIECLTDEALTLVREVLDPYAYRYSLYLGSNGIREVVPGVGPEPRYANFLFTDVDPSGLAAALATFNSAR